MRAAGARAIHARLGAPVWIARTDLDTARMLVERARPGDRERACALLEQVLATARWLGLRMIGRRALTLGDAAG